MRRRRLGALLGLALAVVACAGKKRVTPPDQLWSEANEAFADEAYEFAVERYKALLDQHPFDANAEQAQLRIAQAHYLAKRYPEAIAAFGDFERMHPTSAHLPQVEYELGMSHLAQATTVDRDQQAYTSALTYFRNVIDRFPRSSWAEKARLRLRECREALASHEADIATYYLRQGNLRAAEARLRGLLTDYPEADATARALDGFAREYARREEPEGATLALATLVRYHPEGQLGRDARERLGADGASPALLDGQDPLPLLVGRIDRMRQEADRQAVRPTVSAYPDVGGVGRGRY
jgi:outer membrane protein assembly factor BamD